MGDVKPPVCEIADFGWWVGSVREDDGAVAIDEGAVVDVVADAAGEGGAFAVSAEAGEVCGGVEVLYAFDFLVDDGSGVEVGGDVVAGCADEFDAALVGLLVGVCADEGGEEAVVDVDDAAGVGVAEVVREDLHEACEDDEFDVLLVDEVADLLEAGEALVAVHFDEVEGDVGVLGDGLAVGSVADDRGDFDGEFAEAGAPEDFLEAVVGFGDEDGGPHFVGEAAEVPVGAEGAAEGAEAVDEVLGVDVEVCGCDFESGEEFCADGVGELVEFEEVSAMAGDVSGDFGDDTGLVGAAEFEDQAGARHVGTLAVRGCGVNPW